MCRAGDNDPSLDGDVAECGFKFKSCDEYDPVSVMSCQSLLLLPETESGTLMGDVLCTGLFREGGDNDFLPWFDPTSNNELPDGFLLNNTIKTWTL